MLNNQQQTQPSQPQPTQPEDNKKENVWQRLNQQGYVKNNKNFKKSDELAGEEEFSELKSERAKQWLRDLKREKLEK